MRMPSEAPFLRVAFSLRRRSSSAFISSSDMAFSFSLEQFYPAALAVRTQIATKRLRLHGRTLTRLSNALGMCRPGSRGWRAQSIGLLHSTPRLDEGCVWPGSRRVNAAHAEAPASRVQLRPQCRRERLLGRCSKSNQVVSDAGTPQ